jgi:YggT family protein
VQDLTVFRYAVFAVFAAGALIALAAWAVRTRQVNPFGTPSRALRAISEPFVRPMERWLVKNGRNPQSAALWIFGITLVGGIVLITAVTWVIGQVGFVRGSATSGRGVLRLVVLYAGRLILLALIVRVIASWFGQFRYSKWIRWAYWLTDWMIEPLRKIIPPIGMFDFTPLIAWFGLQILLNWLMRVL